MTLKVSEHSLTVRDLSVTRGFAVGALTMIQRGPKG
jgi:hypothetical protein